MALVYTLLAMDCLYTLVYVFVFISQGLCVHTACFLHMLAHTSYFMVLLYQMDFAFMLICMWVILMVFALLPSELVDYIY